MTTSAPHELVWSESKRALADLGAVAAKVIAELDRLPCFIIWLQGPVGAGKTALVREMLWQMGLPKSQPVTSPTFTYFNEYQIGKATYYHCDFYRDGSPLSWEDSGVSWPERGGFFVEWGGQGKMQTELSPSHILEVDYPPESPLGSRSYRLYRVTSASGPALA